MTSSDRWTMGGGLAVFVIIALPLWREFSIPGQTGWNVFLCVLLVGMAVAAFLLQNYFRTHSGAFGEARFDTRNRPPREGSSTTDP